MEKIEKMKNLFDALVILVIIGAFVFAGFVLTAFGTVIAGAFYLVEIIVAVIMTLIVIIGGTLAVLFSPNEEKKEKDNAG